MQAELISKCHPVREGNTDRVRIGSHDGCEFFLFKDAEEVLQIWEKLQQDSLCSPFQRHIWVKALVKSGKKSKSSSPADSDDHVFVVGFANAKPVMIFPFALRKRLLGDQIVWLGEKISDYNGVIIDSRYRPQASPALLDSVLDMLYAALPSVHAVHLIRNPAGSFINRQIGDGSSINSNAEYHSHALALNKDWKQLRKSIRSPSSIQRLGGKLRALKRSGKIRFGRVRGDNLRLEATKQILNWKSDHLLQNGSRNPFGTRENVSPVRMAIEYNISSGTGSLEVFGLFRDGNLIAGMLVFVTGGRFYYYVSAYSPQVDRKYSVGTLLLVRVLEVAARAGMKQFDFLIGDEAYKRDWCDTKISLLHFTRPFTFRGEVICALIRLRLAIKKFVMRHPKIIGFAKRQGKYYREYVRRNIFETDRVNTSGSIQELPPRKIDWGKTGNRTHR